MAWPTYSIRGWNDLHKISDMSAQVATGRSSGILFRGQSNADWSLKPSLSRVLGAENVANAIELEKTGVEEFNLITRDLGGTCGEFYSSSTSVSRMTSSIVVTPS
jgi:hypothetical protein